MKRHQASSFGQSQISRSRGHIARSNAWLRDRHKHQNPASCPHSPNLRTFHLEIWRGAPPNFREKRPRNPPPWGTYILELCKVFFSQFLQGPVFEVYNGRVSEVVQRQIKTIEWGLEERQRGGTFTATWLRWTSNSKSKISEDVNTVCSFSVSLHKR